MRVETGHPGPVFVPHLAWYGDTEMELRFPPSWRVSVWAMAGQGRPKLTRQQIEKSFASPIGAGPLRELAQGKKEVAVLVDDLTRPTPCAVLVPYVLRGLREAGVPDESVRFVVAVGGHAPLNGFALRKKLGEAVTERFPVYNHNTYENCAFLGKTSRGTPVSINSEVLSCDLKIGIGCILPHHLAGFSGGGKIMAPGVASVDTICANHALASPEMGMGMIAGNQMQADVREAAAMAGLDIKIDAIVNTRREITALFVGEPSREHDRGVEVAKAAYATRRDGEVDVLVANLYAKAEEAGLFVPHCARLLGENGGELVLLADAPAGQVTHYLARSFGKSVGGRRWSPRKSLPPRVKRLIVLSSTIDRAGEDWLGPVGSVTWARTWDQVVTELEKNGILEPRVAVIPDASMQYFPA